MWSIALIKQTAQKLMRLLRSLKAARSYGNAFAAPCNRRCRLRSPHIRHCRNWERSSTARSADLVVLSLLEASSEARANALKDLSEFGSGGPVIALASTNDVGLARAAIGYGAKGFIPVTMGFEIAIEVMRFVLAGGTYVPPDHLLAPDRVSLQAPTTLSRPNVLTSRELAVVRAIQEGKSNKVIAHELNMCLSTVKVHVRNVMRKMKAKNRTDVAMKA